MLSTAGQESSEKNSGKKLNVECDIDENFKITKDFSQFFLQLCSALS
jgi:hypothetical protein